MEKNRVLIAENDAGFRASLEARCIHDHVSTETAGSARECIDKLREFKPRHTNHWAGHHASGDETYVTEWSLERRFNPEPV